MENKNTIGSDDVLRLKIIILTGYMIVTIVFIIWSGSDQVLIDQLTLQLGSVIKDIYLKL